MTIQTRILFVALASVCVLGGGTASAQDKKTDVHISVSDDGKKRHIVVTRDGKVIKDEWVESKDGKRGYKVTTDKNGEVQITPIDTDDVITFGGQGKPGTWITGKDGMFKGQGKAGTWITTKDGKMQLFKDGKPGEKFDMFKPGVGQNFRFEMKPGKDGKMQMFQNGKPIEGWKGGVFEYKADGKGFQQFKPGKDGMYRFQGDKDGYFKPGKGSFFTPGQGGVILGRNNLGELLRSLTREQKNKQDRQGYLTLRDLTPAQRQMFNVPKGDDWKITYEVDGQRLQLRGK
jgi:hypothetical protein